MNDFNLITHLIYPVSNSYAILVLEGQLNRSFDFLIARKYGQKGRQVELVFRELKAQICWPTTDQKVRGSNPCGRTHLK